MSVKGVRIDMGVQDVIALSVAGVAAVYVARKMWRSLGVSGGCHCAQADPTATGTPPCAPRTGIKQTPLLPPDQVGTPEP